MPFAINEGINQYEYTHGNSVAEEAFSDMSNRSRVTCSERLPGAVLQAKERLLHRLRGAAVSERSAFSILKQSPYCIYSGY